ncbi:MAG TPA: serine/threonine-protein kinase, partial [Gammaproteobacteria bacterium]
MTLQNDNNTLPPGYLLHWYEIIDVIGRGGFGITYLARDKNLDMLVAIKEYLPEDFANRKDNSTVQPKTGQQAELYDWGLERFVTEARILAKFTHPNIVRVLSVFEQNNTAYMVMEYAQGEDLSTVYKRRRKENQLLDEHEYLDIFIPICDGLSLVHNEGFIHRDIKPANIYICHDSLPMLLDFGSARQSVEHKTKALTSLVTFGYAPFEQYQEGTGKQGPWTDIYSLGASIYVGITGKKPEDAMSRGGQILETGKDSYKPLSQIASGQFSEHFLLAVDNALMFKADDRPKHILRWADMLLGNVAAPALPKNLYIPVDTSEIEKTVIMPRDRQTGKNTDRSSKVPTTAPSRGSQGFVNSLGKRLRVISHEVEQPVQASVARLGDIAKSIVSSIQKFMSALPANALFMSAVALIFILVMSFIIVNMSDPKDAAESPEVVQQSRPEELKKEPEQENIDDLLGKAQEAYTAMRYTQPKGSSAYDYLQSVLAVDANSKIARQGLNDIQQQLFRQAESLFNSGDTNSALKPLGELLAINPNDTKAQELRNTILGSSQKQEQIGELLVNAEKSLSQKNYTQPDKANAYYFYKQVLGMDASNSKASKGIQTIQKTLLANAQTEYKGKRYSQAIQYLDELKSIGFTSADTDSLRNQIAKIQDKNQLIESILSEAQVHLNNNRYSTPENNNAYDSYIKVLKLDQSNKGAISGIEIIKNFYSDQFDRHIASNDIKSASYDLQRMKVIAPGSLLTRNMEKTLSQYQKMVTKKPEIELVSELIGMYKIALETKDLSKLRKISKFKPGREQFVKGVFQQYKDFTVVISGFEFIAKEQRGRATVELTKMT